MSFHKKLTEYPNSPDIESSSEEYAKRFKGKVGKWLLLQQKNATRNLIQGDNLNILDVGGGHGQNIDTIQEMGHSLTVLASTEQSLDPIRDKLVKQDVQYDIGSFLDFPYADNSFDVVISYRTLSHMDDPERFVAELSRVARSQILVDFPSTASINLLYKPAFWIKKKLEPSTREFQSFSVKSVGSFFESDRFEIETVYKQFFLPMALHRMVRIRLFSAISEKTFRLVGLTSLLGSPVIVSLMAI